MSRAPGLALSTTCATIDRRQARGTRTPGPRTRRRASRPRRRPRHGARPSPSVPRCSLVETRAARIEPSEPESSRNAGTSMSSAGYVRNDSKRFSIVMPGEQVDRRRRARGSAATRARCAAGSAARGAERDDGGADRERDAQRSRSIGVTTWKPSEVGREEQARQRHHVARGGHDRRRDVVEVEARGARRTRRPRP